VRLQVRPSGTEPKVKLYGEGIGNDPADLLAALAALIV
jgi:phosphomannomutase